MSRMHPMLSGLLTTVFCLASIGSSGDSPPAGTPALCITRPQAAGEAVAKEDRLAYSEPADWFFPVRHILGAALIKAGAAAHAEAVYRDDLRRNPNNGWALFGLARSLRLQGRDGEALKAQQQFETAWKTRMWF